MGAVVCRGTAPGAWDLVTPLGDQPGESADLVATLLLLAGRCRLLPAAAWCGEKGGKQAGWTRAKEQQKGLCAMAASPCPTDRPACRAP